MRVLAFAAILAGLAEPALAHHAMGGEMPVTAFQGLLSGFAHPILGLDHFAAVIAAGCLAAWAGIGAGSLAGYVALMLAGAALHAAGFGLPAVEPSVALSLLVLGAVLADRRLRSATIALVLFGATGFIHGYALGESIVGAEPAPLYAYFGGLALVQFAIAFAAMRAAQWMLSNGRAVTLRLAGAAIAGVGLVLFVQSLSG